MDNELIKSIEARVDGSSELALVHAADLQELLQVFRDSQKVSLENNWPWMELRKKSNEISFSNYNEWSDILEKLLPADSDIVLVVTDEEPQPWFAVSGKRNSLLDLLEEHRHFEYFMVPYDTSWYLFESHDNFFVHSLNQ